MFQETTLHRLNFRDPRTNSAPLPSYELHITPQSSTVNPLCGRVRTFLGPASLQWRDFSRVVGSGGKIARNRAGSGIYRRKCPKTPLFPPLNARGAGSGGFRAGSGGFRGGMVLTMHGGKWRNPTGWALTLNVEDPKGGSAWPARRRTHLWTRPGELLRRARARKKALSEGLFIFCCS